MSDLGQQLDQLEQRLAAVLRDLRLFRQDWQRAQRDKGVLGSRGLSEYVLALLREGADIRHQVTGEMVRVDSGYTVHELLRSAELTGYTVPTANALHQRLRQRHYRVGDVEYVALTKRWRWATEQQRERENTDVDQAATVAGTQR